MFRKKGQPKPLKKYFSYLFEEHEASILHLEGSGWWYADIESDNLLLRIGTGRGEDFIRFLMPSSNEYFELPAVIALILNEDPFKIYNSYKFFDFKVEASLLKQYYSEINNAFSPENLAATIKRLKELSDELSERIMSDLRGKKWG